LAGRLWIDAHIHIRAHEPDGGPCDFSLRDILDVLDKSDADLVWLISLAGPEVTRVKKDPTAVGWANEGLSNFIKPAAGRLFGSVLVHPGAVKESCECIDRFIGDENFVQVGEVLGAGIGFEMDSAQMIEIVRHAAEYGAPVQMHCSTNAVRTGEHIAQTINVARAVPEATVVAAHAIGGVNSYQYIEEGEKFYKEGGDNLYFEIRDFNRREYLRAAYESLGPDRLIVGTDWIARGSPPFPPYGILFPLERINDNPYPCTVESLVGFLRESGVTEDDIDKIGSRNIIRLFHLREKGLKQ